MEDKYNSPFNEIIDLHIVPSIFEVSTVSQRMPFKDLTIVYE